MSPSEQLHPGFFLFVKLVGNKRVSQSWVRLSFSGGQHAPVNMEDSMENASNWTVSGSREVMEVPKNFKDLQKLVYEI